MTRLFIVAVLIGAAAPALAQQVNGVSVNNAPDGGSASSQDDTGAAADPGGLSSRGGQALQSRKTFQATIGTSIYTPIGTSMYTPVQRPPDSTTPQS
jgi:archaellum component FlaG (FlaF/FlaG flagellin family)